MKTVTMTIFSALVIALVLSVTPAFAATPGFGNLYYNGTIVRTVVPPAAFPNEGRDNFYHGGHWKVFTVTFNSEITPVLLTSEQAVLSAQNAGMVTVTRNAAADFLCPVQP